MPRGTPEGGGRRDVRLLVRVLVGRSGEVIGIRRTRRCCDVQLVPQRICGREPRERPPHLLPGG
eukprot:347666-Pyramimonas_sp.AAC.1